MANWFPLALEGSARSWLMNLPEGSISSWEELCEQFVASFKGTYKQPATISDLQAVKQRPRDTLRQYVQRFSQVRRRIPRISDASIIATFIRGVADERMLEKCAILGDDLSSAVQLFELADKCAKAEEGRLFKHSDPDEEPGHQAGGMREKRPPRGPLVWVRGTGHHLTRSSIKGPQGPRRVACILGGA
ncbi:hypothetical protein VPH35_057756 [Triticum aestivum]